MPRHCSSKHALLRGQHPTAHAYKLRYSFCSKCCIYCDIWKLAALMATRVPISTRRTNSEPNTPSAFTAAARPRAHSYSTSRLSLDFFDYNNRERAIEAQFQTQRARLASIMSICTVEGAEESEGLRLAHDRCLAIVTELLRQEHSLERKTGVADLREMSKYQGQGEMERHERRECRVQEGWMGEDMDGDIRRGARCAVSF